MAKATGLNFFKAQNKEKDLLALEEQGDLEVQEVDNESEHLSESTADYN